MIKIKSFKELGRAPIPGDRVKITSSPRGTWFCKDMKKYLSSIMTVRKYTDENMCYMVEDQNDFHENSESGWLWEMCDIEGAVIEEYEDIVEDTSLWNNDKMLDALLT